MLMSFTSLVQKENINRNEGTTVSVTVVSVASISVRALLRKACRSLPPLQCAPPDAQTRPALSDRLIDVKPNQPA